MEHALIVGVASGGEGTARGGGTSPTTPMPIGRLVTMEEIADATDFLLSNTGVNAQNLCSDRGPLAS